MFNEKLKISGKPACSVGIPLNGQGGRARGLFSREWRSRWSEIIEDFHKTSKDRLGDQSKNIGSPVVL